MGTAAEFMITPYGSLIVGFLCGIISTFGYLFVTVSLQSFTSLTFDLRELLKSVLWLYHYRSKVKDQKEWKVA